MACKFLTQKITIMPPEIGGPPTPQGIPTTACELGREPGIIGWVRECEETPSDGPCWFWIQQYGSNTTDEKFGR